jgi:hypothetical protein
MNVSSSRVSLEMLCLSGTEGLIGVFLTVGFLVLASGPAEAQSFRESNRDREPRQERSYEPDGSAPSQSPTNLPSWAEPSPPQDGGITSPDEVGTRAPSPPDNPSRIPVDGGLALLAAAGAGYAVRKLNEEDDDEDPVA